MTADQPFDQELYDAVLDDEPGWNPPGATCPASHGYRLAARLAATIIAERDAARQPFGELPRIPSSVSEIRVRFMATTDGWRGRALVAGTWIESEHNDYMKSADALWNVIERAREEHARLLEAAAERRRIEGASDE